MSYIAANGSDLSTIFKNIASDVSFTQLVTFSKYIQNSFAILNSNATFTKTNLPNIIYITGSTGFSITLPNDASFGIVIYVRQVSGTSALSISYPNNVRLGNNPTSPIAYMTYSLCSMPDNSNNVYWYLLYYN